ncbi:hypothetical protein LTR37_016072 [Vermiconidia calcicola]|uniref:Uncharacterized protein n=1 Tax=Vermiconidia calcicola TaxID=1690605 RepID=A0ACC3MQF7_9PEZI|nr:hypothetical protein LTR37_016072 [Vermiconidia calcicola]
MPHGPLTPLGRHLRSVLAALRPTASYSTAPQRQDRGARRITVSRPLVARATHARNYHVSTQARAAGAAAATQTSKDEDEEEDAYSAYVPFLNDDVAEPGEDGSSLRGQAGQRLVGHHSRVSRSQLNRRAKVDRITEALRSTGQTDVTPWPSDGMVNLSYVNVRSPDGWQQYRVNSERHRDDYIPTLEHASEMTIPRILASYIKHRSEVANTGEADWMTPFPLLPAEEDMLTSKGYGMNDLQAWAEILQLPDSLEVANALSKRVETNGIDSVPFFLMSYVLRRRYISGSALRIIIRQAWRIVDHRMSGSRTLRLSQDSVFYIFLRLVRHARVVWPTALASLAAMLLHFLPRTAPNDRTLSYGQLESLTYRLNKAMRLIAAPTSIEPFKNNALQEAAIVRILRFMAEHDPPLNINREGYRAVILVQLAQQKTPSERQWGLLKALSWPPWKEERTAMDADFTREEHGLTKAGETLQRMREAGFQPEDWENAAAIYTGWDTDQTPTVQTRVVFGAGFERLKTGTAAWVGRITTTRTAQEAWAAYLAYEDADMPPDQDVYLAIFRKLHKEDERNKGKDSRMRNNRASNERRLLPGDTQEIEPLPPSTHLYTYTRTSPPTVSRFYQQLRDKGVVLEGHCLAFIVAKATTARLGMEHFYESAAVYPCVPSFMLLDDDSDLSEVPRPLFAAFIELLSRFSKVPISKALPLELRSARRHALNTTIFKNRPLSADHALVHAIELLRRQRPLYRPAWNSVLRALSNESSLGLELTSVFEPRGDTPGDQLSEQQELWRSSITAWRLLRRVLREMESVHLDLDATGFKALCQGAENLAIWCWLAMRDFERKRTEDDGAPESGTARALVREANVLLRGSSILQRIRGEFRTLIGEGGAPSDCPGPQLPKLLEVPGPAILHAYIRALGWLADHDGLLETVRWMVKYQTELAHRRERDRNGEAVMRRAIVALRVFFERSWLYAAVEEGRLWQQTLEDQVEQLTTDRRTRQQLARFEGPASADIVDEVRGLVESAEDWGGWPTEDETEEYCGHYRFQLFLQ